MKRQVALFFLAALVIPVSLPAQEHQAVDSASVGSQPVTATPVGKKEI